MTPKNKIKTIGLSYDEVWCSESDAESLKSVFCVTPVVSKIFIPKGKALIVKRKDVAWVSGITLAGKNEVIGIMEL